MVGAAEHARGQLVKIIADFFGVRVVRAVEGRQTFPDIIAVFLQKGLGKLVGPGNTAQKASLVGEHPLDHRSEILPDGLPVALVGGFQEGLHRFPVAGIQEGTVILKVFHLLLLEDHDAVFALGDLPGEDLFRSVGEIPLVVVGGQAGALVNLFGLDDADAFL